MGSLAVAVLLVGLALFIWSGFERHTRRVAAMDRKLDAIIEELGIVDRVHDLTRVRELVRADDRVGAVKAYREETGAGLVEAKQAVDRIAAESE